ncbi:MAG: ComF family protein [Woeseiaceae bacterium]
MKFGRQLVYAPALAELLLPTLNEFFAETDVLVPVPLHRRRHIRRGFNQSAEICRTLAKRTGRPVCEQAKRRRHTKTQSGLTAPQRRRNLHNAFKVRGTLAGSQPLIVDDVITTGTTCDTLAQALLAAGAVRVGVLTVARSSIRVLQ